MWLNLSIPLYIGIYYKNHRCCFLHWKYMTLVSLASMLMIHPECTFLIITLFWILFWKLFGNLFGNLLFCFGFYFESYFGSCLEICYLIWILFWKLFYKLLGNLFGSVLSILEAIWKFVWECVIYSGSCLKICLGRIYFCYCI